MSFLAIKLGFASMPESLHRPAKLYGIAVLTGGGFTMSLFIGTLAFDDEGVLIRLGVLAGSLLSGIVAALVLAAGGGSE